MHCRHCETPLEYTFLDLGFAPLSNSYLEESQLSLAEKYYPLKVKVCHSCWLVQTEDYAEPEEIFNASYPYLSSTSRTWLEHAKSYVKQVTSAFKLNKDSYVVEIACNDGYLLKNFVDIGIPCLGVEPASLSAKIASLKGVPVIESFFNEKLAYDLKNAGKSADLIVGNNVFAHVPDINSFTRAMKIILRPNGVITLEFPHLLRLIEQNQFDTIYHEHFSYLSLTTVRQVFEKSGLKIWRVDELETHGGSLRVYGSHREDPREIQSSVFSMLSQESTFPLNKIDRYLNFQSSANSIKYELLTFLIDAKNRGKRVVGYGAAAKGNTLINFAGIKPDLIPVIYDAAESKQNRVLPGSHIPILSPDKMAYDKFDYVLILPWNISSEILSQLRNSVDRRVEFLTAVPKLKFL